ncbi:MAG: PEGA domain-containing protein [Methanoregulaceae archaeon]|nr:PEGA domain-containing protein [Methanoregulaceae archaeon]
MKTGYLILVGCVIFLAIAASASATQVMVTPKKIDSGDTIYVSVQGMPDGQKFGVTAKGSFIVNSGDTFTFQTENITIPILGGAGSFTVKNKNTAENNIIVGEFENPEEGEEPVFHFITFSGPTIGEVFSGKHNFDDMESGNVNVTWEGMALGDTKSVFTLNSQKLEGPDGFIIPITVYADHPGVVEVVFRQTGQPIYRGEIQLLNPSVTGELSVMSRPTGANVYIDSVFKGMTGAGPLVIDNVPAGMHQIKLTKSGFFPVTRYVNVPDGSTLDVYIKLTRR